MKITKFMMLATMHQKQYFFRTANWIKVSISDITAAGMIARITIRLKKKLASPVVTSARIDPKKTVR